MAGDERDPAGIYFGTNSGSAFASLDGGENWQESDANGQALAHVFFEDKPPRRSAAKLLSKDEARHIAANIAKLPQLLRKS